MTTTNPSNLDFARAAEGFLGVRWVARGRSRDGVDCSGLVVASAREVGLEIEPVRPKYDPRSIPDRMILDGASKIGDFVSPDHDDIGLVALCTSRRSRYPSHLAIRISYSYYLHADMQRGQVMMSPARAIKSRLVLNLRLHGLEWRP